MKDRDQRPPSRRSCPRRAPQRYEDGAVLKQALAVLQKDIRRHLRRDQALREDEHLFRSMFEEHDTAMVVVEPESGAIVDANPAAVRLYGYSRACLQTMKTEQLNILSPQFLRGQRRRALKGKQNHFVFRHRLASGQLRSVEVHSSPIRLKGHSLLFSIIHDVTERLRLERQLLDIIEQERQRIGRDLHDSLGGMLVGAALMGRALAQTLAAKADPAAGIAEEVVTCINESVAQTRAIARGLCPLELSGAGLCHSLAQLATETEKRFGIACRFQSTHNLVLADPSAAVHLYRITQEAVSNAVRHADPHSVLIRLSKTGSLVKLTIRDDGKGLPAQLPATQGLGLQTMRYRAHTIGAQLEVKRAAGGGTLVSCSLLVGVTE